MATSKGIKNAKEVKKFHKPKVNLGGSAGIGAKIASDKEQASVVSACRQEDGDMFLKRFASLTELSRNVSTQQAVALGLPQQWRELEGDIEDYLRRQAGHEISQMRQ